jgi:hypothetical protein
VLVATEIDNAVTLLVTTAFVANGQTADVIATTMLLQIDQKRFFWNRAGDVREIGPRHIATAC